MAEGPPGPTQSVDTDADFEPLSRPRSCTWPLRRPEQLQDPGSSSTSSPAPSLAQESNGEYISNLALLEEDYGEYTEQKSPVPCDEYQGSCILHHHHHHHHPPPPPPPQQQQQQQQQQLLGPHVQAQQQVPAPGAPLGAPCSVSQRKSCSSRRNAWGNMSYADLITKAIESSPEKRLTLSQIYDWMVKSVPYFNDKGDSNSSAGWKNSIRHNLSLHSRFVRIQNEGTGKSSWWMMNPEGGKNGKSPRRRAASMDNNSKFTKSRGRATKKKMAVADLVDSSSHSPSPQYSHWLGSPHSQSTEDLDAWSTFRNRTSSDASTLSGRRSPFASEQDEVCEPDLHMGYSVGPKLTATLPRLSEVTGSIAQRGSENVMENLFDNLNLLPPQNSPVATDTALTSNGAMHQNSPFTSSHHKGMYNQVKMTPLLSVHMQTNKASFVGYEKGYNCLPVPKDLLLSDGEVTRGSLIRTGGALAPYNSQSLLNPRNKVKMLPPSQSIPPLSLQSPLPSRELNSCNMIPLTSLTSRPGPPSRLSHITHGNNFMVSSSGNGYAELMLVHPRARHQERLPSDLDNMSIERFECDMESVLHDTLMDGGALDFNFEPAGAQGFPPRGKNTVHSWVSG
ncbi:forkhead box protein O1-B-like [Eucyclogobius newberryi]|uniref:forkhead box protein O1-B-like n=1 Tax=Eucyclogobius newberryi TaxID=166745 RepID=UPI003B5A39FF